MKSVLLTCAAVLACLAAGIAQIPKNAEKHYEYKEIVTLKRAGTGDIYRRLEKWAGDKFDADREVLLDDTNNRFITIETEMTLPESHFGVNRTHRDRIVQFLLKFDIDRKEYTYSLTEIRYRHEEENNKGMVTQDSLLLEQLKGPTTKSVEEEVDLTMRALIDEFKEAALTELE